MPNLLRNVYHQDRLKGGETMLWEASIAILTLMGLLWGAAVWASYQEESDKGAHSAYSQDRKAA